MSKVKPTTNGIPLSMTPNLALKRNMWKALLTLTKMMQSSLLSSSVAWLLAFGVSQGNLLSGRPPEQQSYVEFLVVKILWFDGLYWAFTIAASVRRLLPEWFASRPTRSTLSAAQILGKLLPRVCPYAAGVTLASVGGGTATAYLPISYKKCRLDLYWTLTCCTFFVAAADAHTRHIFRSDTLKGRAREQMRCLRSRGTPNLQSVKRSLSVADFVRAFRQNIPFVVAALLAAGYVHVVSYFSITHQWGLLLFALISTFVKVMTQEVAKHYLTKQNKPPTMRSMVVIIAAPTIMIDTQLRTILLCQESASLTIIGTLVLAIVEVCYHAAKIFYVAKTTRNVLAKHSFHRIGIPVLPQRSSAVQDESTASSPGISPLPWLKDVFWAHEKLAHHSAEVYADMCAEYIAMGCSYAILFFFGIHPKFKLGSRSSATHAQTIQVKTTVFQVLVEIVVDLVASTLEIYHGVDFDRINEDNAYLAFFVAVVAVANIHISSGVYLRL